MNESQDEKRPKSKSAKRRKSRSATRTFPLTAHPTDTKGSIAIRSEKSHDKEITESSEAKLEEIVSVSNLGSSTHTTIKVQNHGVANDS